VNINTQRGQESGYCTWNPLGAGTNIVVSNGNLDATSNTNAWRQIKGTIGVTSGKWYWECTDTGTNSSTDNQYHGISNDLETPATNLGTVSGYCYGDNGDKYAAGTNTGGAGATYTNGDVIGMALDLDSGTKTITFYKNGILQFTQTITGSSPWHPASNCYYSQTGPIFTTTFGQKPFKFPPPAGFQPLALANLPRPTIVRPDQFMGIVTYTGNSTDNRKITVGFKPDFVWFKSRSNSGAHALFDSIRGTNMLASNETGAESSFGSPPIGGYLNTFERDGFTVKNGSTNNTYVNESAYTYVAWCWKAGGSGGGYSFWKDDIGYSTAAAAGLTAGTITPTGASVNTKSGFSIIGYTGPGTPSSTISVGHGLNVAPTFLIFKDRDSSVNWQVWTTASSSSGTVIEGLNNTASGTTPWTYISTTSSLIQFNSGNSAQTSNGKKFICYAWHDVPGFSKFGSYTGNGSADGPMVVTGFRPRWIIIKSTAEGSWPIMDSSRDTYNATGLYLWSDLPNAEVDNRSLYPIDFLSNGFKIRNSTIAASSTTYIYAAFAEAPAQNLFGGQSNAR